MRYTYLHRLIEKEVTSCLNQFPAVAVLGPRQCGKSTLARYLTGRFPDSIYLDLEKPSDLRKVDEMKEAVQVIIKPLITEKSTLQKEMQNQIAFIVDRRANKIEIGQAIEQFYKSVDDVEVVGVNPSELAKKVEEMFILPEQWAETTSGGVAKVRKVMNMLNKVPDEDRKVIAETFDHHVGPLAAS